MASTSSKTKNQASGLGRRKRASAFAKLATGTGTITVNGRDYKNYFPLLTWQQVVVKPLITVGLEKYAIQIKVAGGGQAGQADAVALAIARALVVSKDTHKQALRSAGLLTRDARKRQRRMVGTGGKARRKKQSPKR